MVSKSHKLRLPKGQSQARQPIAANLSNHLTDRLNKYFSKNLKEGPLGFNQYFANRFLKGSSLDQNLVVCCKDALMHLGSS